MINVDLREESLLGTTDSYIAGRQFYLSRGLSLDVAFEDLFGPGGHPERRPDLLVILTHHPELNVLIAELGLQEGLEDLYPV